VPSLKANVHQTNAALAAMVKRFGWRNALWLVQFQASWALAVRDNGWQPIDAEEFAEAWKISRAKGFRDLQKWRALTGAEGFPNQEILDARAKYEAAIAELGAEADRDQVAALLTSYPGLTA
jgi:hypothetical protein